MKIFKTGDIIKASDINSNFAKCIKTDLSNCPIIPVDKGGTGKTDYTDMSFSAPDLSNRTSIPRNTKITITSHGFLHCSISRASEGYIVMTVFVNDNSINLEANDHSKDSLFLPVKINDIVYHTGSGSVSFYPAR